MKRITSRLEAEELLKTRGVQPTSQRVEVLYRLHASQRHLAAEDLHECLNEEFTRVSRATVYNTLNLLKSYGLVGAVLVDAGRILYDANTEPHYHMYDVDTGELTDIGCGVLPPEALPGIPDDRTMCGVDVIIKVSKKRSEQG